MIGIYHKAGYGFSTWIKSGLNHFFVFTRKMLGFSTTIFSNTFVRSLSWHRGYRFRFSKVVRCDSKMITMDLVSSTSKNMAVFYR